MGLKLGTNFFVTGFWLPFFMETNFMHWIHGIEDTDAYDVVGYYYLILWL